MKPNENRPSETPLCFSAQFQPAPEPRKDAAMPLDLQHHLDELELWARGNKRDAQRDATAFWLLKVPAILAAASAGVWAHFALTTVSVIAGAIASLCVIIDGVHPRGMLRNTHMRAYHDIRMLTARMTAEWRSRTASSNDHQIARRIIQHAEAERPRIGRYVRDAEAALTAKDAV